MYRFLAFCLLDESAELGKVKGAETTGGIPARLGRETNAVTAGVAARGDITESGLGLGGVEERVDEAEVGLALGLAVVVEGAKEGSNGRR